MSISDDDLTARRAGGRIVRHDSTETILRSLTKRLDNLEREISGTITREYVITDPVTTWTVTHYLNRYVVAVLYDSTGNQVPVTVQCPDKNTVTLAAIVDPVTLAATAFSGTAIIV